VSALATSPHRASLVGSVTCTAILALAGTLSGLGQYLTIGGLAIGFLVFFGGAYLLPLGGTGMGIVALLTAPHPRGRRVAGLAIAANVFITGLLYVLAATFLEM